MRDDDAEEQERIDKILYNLFFNESTALISEGVTFDPVLRYVISHLFFYTILIPSIVWCMTRTKMTKLRLSPGNENDVKKRKL
jgi:hypothetical protein